MPLPPSRERQAIHTRRIECRGFRRTDGLWDIEGHLVDTKTHDFTPLSSSEIKAGQPVHEMWLRLTVDENLLIHDVVAVTEASPYPICPQAAPSLETLKGLSIKSGWTGEVKRRLGGAASCTHLVELLGPMATTAHQTLVLVRQHWPDVLDREGRPVRIDSCYAYGSDRDLVRQRWPAHYTGTSPEQERSE